MDYNYIVNNYPNKIKIRNIIWLEYPAPSGSPNNILTNYDNEFSNIKTKALNKGSTYIAFHSYNRDILNIS